MQTSPSPQQNLLLAALPTAEFERIIPHLELVALTQGEVLCGPGAQLQHVHFPTTAIVSLNYVTENGASTEIAGIGNEGVLGFPIFMGGQTTLSGAIACVGGHTYRLKAAKLMQEFHRAGGRRGGRMQHLLLRYTQALMTQISQMAVCNRYHSVEQQLCRWLLLTLDRSSSNELTMTQELIARMIGVRREGISEAAGHLQQAGLIRNRRGHITVLNRTGLESRVCECYAVVKNEFSRLLSDVGARQELHLANFAEASLCATLR